MYILSSPTLKHTFQILKSTHLEKKFRTAAFMERECTMGFYYFTPYPRHPRTPLLRLLHLGIVDTQIQDRSCWTQPQ